MSQDIPPELMQRYIASFPEKVKALNSAINQFKLKNDESTIKELRLLVHKLAGSSSSYGFNKIASGAREVLKLLDESSTLDIEAIITKCQSLNSLLQLEIK